MVEVVVVEAIVIPIEIAILAARVAVVLDEVVVGFDL